MKVEDKATTQPMEGLLRHLFHQRFGEPVESMSALKGDGSHRKIYKLSSPQRKVIGVTSPDRRENEAFLGFTRHFYQSGLPVPEIYAQDIENGVYLEEDLGDLTLFQLLSSRRTQQQPSREVTEVYKQVVQWLPRFQLVAGKTLDYRLCYPRASFDRQSMMWDLNYFKYYFLRLSRIPFDEQALEDDFERFTDYLLAADRDYFLYRDFQSRNVMVREGRPYFIDYQGGRKGALQYDIASLLFDAKADLPFELRAELLDCYLEAAQALAPIDPRQFHRYYPGYVFIRIMQALGAYGWRGFYERKAHFLQSIPYAIRNLEVLLRSAELPVELPSLMQVFESLVQSSALRQLGDADLKLTVRIQSFSYRNGVPGDEKGHGGGFIFDCRALPNPGRYEQFAQFSGNDSEVVAFLERELEVGRFMNHVQEIIGQTVENYQSRNFTDLLVAFGCTGGQHRSVYCANLLASHLRQKYQVNVELQHRELQESES
jgi:aminoglycoside/choline kinase family phosphotransferase